MWNPPPSGKTCYNCHNGTTTGNYYYSDQHKLRKKWYCEVCERRLIAKGILDVELQCPPTRSFVPHGCHA